jgi:hypothetical protein
MRRAVPLLIAALLAVPASASAAEPPVKPHPTDAAAITALVRAANVVEGCAAREWDYTNCDDRPAAWPRVRIGWASSSEYGMRARSKQGRMFRIEREFDTRKLICSPRGRGACGRKGTWKPRPALVAGPSFATQWLERERELAARIETIVTLLNECRAQTGDYSQCLTAEVESLLRWEFLIRPIFLYLRPTWYDLRAQAWGSATTLAYTMYEDGIPERFCHKVNPALQSVCVDETW